MAAVSRTGFIVLLAIALPFATSAAAPLVLDVPLVHQKKDGCGAAALAMVLDYWRAARPELALPPADSGALYQALYATGEKGIPASVLISYLDRIGFHALPLNAARTDIEDQLAQGRPLIAALKDGPRLHYVVIRGIEPDAVWINDPWDGKSHRLPWRTFDQRWKGGARWLLLAVPQSSSSR